MRGIVKRFLASTVPVVVYVAPSGSSADSAGAVITMASDLAAMAPQTNIGSSTPDLAERRGHLEGPAPEDRQRRGRVRRRARARARPQRRRRAEDGHRRVELRRARGEADRSRRGDRADPACAAERDRRDEDRSEGPRPPHRRSAESTNVEMSFWQRARDFLVDPNLIALMLSIGLIGIVVELWNPGLIFPGTVGAISLILGLYGLQVLPVSLAGLFLMLLAAGFFVADAFLPTHGAADRSRRDPVRPRRAHALRSGRGRVPGVSSGRARDRGDARAPARRRAHAGRPASSAQPGRGRHAGPRRRRGRRAAGGPRARSTASSGRRTPRTALRSSPATTSGSSASRRACSWS